MNTIGFVGGGNMAEALIRGILEAGLYPPEAVWVSDIRPERLKALHDACRVQTSTDNSKLARQVDTLVLCVKPQQMDDVLKEIAPAVREGALVISIAAGIRTEKIISALPQAQVVRVMPNTPAMVGAGAAGIYSANAGAENLERAVKVFTAVGKAAVVENEDLLDSVTAVSGSGPAYFFLLMEEMIKAAAKLGLDEQTAAELVIQTAKGAAMLAEAGAEKGQAPAELRKKVTSPGGTTEAALKVFAESNFSSAVLEALRAACERSRELSA